MITSKSLYKANIVFVFKEHTAPPPENYEMARLYIGDNAKGVQLVDDPMMRMKILDVPQRGLQIAWEAQRLRIDDMRAMEPEESSLVEDAVHAYESLAAPRKVMLDAIGLNLEVYYQTRDVIRAQDHFNEISALPLLIGDSLLDFGWQWTVSEKSKKVTNGYFVKVTAPLEFVVHHNAHFAAKELPAKKDLQDLFLATYAKTHAVAGNLKL